MFLTNGALRAWRVKCKYFHVPTLEPWRLLGVSFVSFVTRNRFYEHVHVKLSLDRYVTPVDFDPLPPGMKHFERAANV